MDPHKADRWFSILRQEESHLSRLIEILQSDQRAVAMARPDDIEENVRLKEMVLSEMQVFIEARRSLLESFKGTAGSGLTFETLASMLPDDRREEAKASLERLRALRASLAELNDLTRRIMVHALLLVRSTLSVIRGESVVTVYGGKGDIRGGGGTVRLVRQSV